MARLKHLRHQRSVHLRGLCVACHTCRAEREFHWPLLLKHPISDRLQSSSDRAVWGTKIKDRIYPRRRRVEPCPHKFRLTGSVNSTLGGQLSEAHLPRSGYTTAKATSRALPGQLRHRRARLYAIIWGWPVGGWVANAAERPSANASQSVDIPHSLSLSSVDLAFQLLGAVRHSDASGLGFVCLLPLRCPLKRPTTAPPRAFSPSEAVHEVTGHACNKPTVQESGCAISPPTYWPIVHAAGVRPARVKR